jgi:hypothetical protein
MKRRKDVHSLVCVPAKTDREEPENGESIGVYLI